MLPCTQSRHGREANIFINAGNDRHTSIATTADVDGRVAVPLRLRPWPVLRLHLWERVGKSVRGLGIVWRWLWCWVGATASRSQDAAAAGGKGLVPWL